ncbi:MAG: hypothetical protein GY849_02215 [Deltaproteobacteria bacterium]|nr:hypothetical protein [Deltaproteobacteria bacterium]
MEYKLFEIAEKYNVNIDLKIRFKQFYKKEMYCIVENDHKRFLIEQSWCNLLMEKVEDKAKELFELESKSHKEIKKELERRAKNKEFFPDDLFD